MWKTVWPRFRSSPAKRRFWPTLLYLFVGIWSYYTFRATSFYLLHFVVYQFVPVMVVATLLGVAVRRRRRARRAA